MANRVRGRDVARSGIGLLLAITVLTGCGGDDESAPQTASATLPSASAALPGGSADSTSVPTSGSGPGTTNRAPTISGTPVVAINAASSYEFVPVSADSDGDTLFFSIANKPQWATFDTVSGRLTGTPTQADVGTYSGITITVTDGKTATRLNAFSISVTQISNGSAMLSWIPPAFNTDGTPLTNLSGYRIYYGTSPAALTRAVDVANAGVASYLVENLSPATWHFAIKAVAGGVESDLSNVATKTIS